MPSYEDIPIDIHYNKLLDWLISRRHAPADWHKSLLIVRSRKAKALSMSCDALKSIPAVVELAGLEDSSVGYFDACFILKTLSQHESFNSLNVLRQYSNPITKSWQELIDVYTKDGVHLAEAAQLILRNVSYEIPALRRQIAKIEQDQQDCIRKQGDCLRQAKFCSEKYSLTCAQLGIEGKNPRNELLLLATDLSSDLGKVEKDIVKLTPAVQFYGSFVKFLTKSTSLPTSFLPLINYIFASGNTTVYEWRTGLKPDVVLSPLSMQSHIQSDQGGNDDGADIDWGDFDIDVAVDSSGFEVVNVDPEAAVEVIVEGSGDKDGGNSPDTPIEVTFGDDNKVAEGEDAVSVFEGQNTRTKLLDDLAELEFFFNQRLEEMKLADSGSQAYVETMAMDLAPKSVTTVTSAAITEYLVIVKEIVNQLTSDRLTHYFKIRSSDAYLNKLVGELEKLKLSGEKAKQLHGLLEIRHEELGKSVPNLTNQIQFLARRTLKLKDAVEEQISAKYNNRVVNLIGEVCQLVNVAK